MQYFTEFAVKKRGIFSIEKIMGLSIGVPSYVF
jgi:hypothetical protein